MRTIIQHKSSTVTKILISSLLVSSILDTMAFNNALTRGLRPKTTKWALSALSAPNPDPMPSRQRPIRIETSMFGSSSSTPKQHDDKTLKPLIVCGPSGVGKGTIIEKYMSELGGKEKFAFTVSHTTRNPRPGEVNDVHYHFTDIPSIKSSIARDEFLEHAEVHGNWYGTSLKSLSFVQEAENKLPMLDIDIQGVKSIKAWEEKQSLGEVSDDIPKLDAKFIFVAPPSLDTLKARLSARGTETPESLERRTKNAFDEVEYGMEEGNFNAIIVNDDLDEACQRFSDAIDEVYSQ